MRKVWRPAVRVERKTLASTVPRQLKKRKEPELEKKAEKVLAKVVEKIVEKVVEKKQEKKQETAKRRKYEKPTALLHAIQSYKSLKLTYALKCPNCKKSFMACEVFSMWGPDPTDIQMKCKWCQHRFVNYLSIKLDDANLSESFPWYCPTQLAYAMVEKMDHSINNDDDGGTGDEWDQFHWINVATKNPSWFWSGMEHFGSYAATMHFCFQKQGKHPDFYKDKRFVPELMSAQEIKDFIVR